MAWFQPRYIVYVYIVLLAFQFPEKGEASVVKVLMKYESTLK